MKTKTLLGLLALLAVITVPLKAQTETVAAADAFINGTGKTILFTEPFQRGALLSANATAINAAASLIAQLSPYDQALIAVLDVQMANVSNGLLPTGTLADQNNIAETYNPDFWASRCASLGDITTLCQASPPVWNNGIYTALTTRLTGNDTLLNTYMTTFVGSSDPKIDPNIFARWFGGYVKTIAAGSGGIPAAKAAIQTEILGVSATPPSAARDSFLRDLRILQELYASMS